MSFKVQCESCEKLIDQNLGQYIEVKRAGPLSPGQKFEWHFCSESCTSSYFDSSSEDRCKACWHPPHNKQVCQRRIYLSEGGIDRCGCESLGRTYPNGIQE